MDGHEMSDGAKWRVGTRFLNNPTGEEIWLHIDARFTPMNQRFICILGNRFPADDGLMGGGEEIAPHKKKLSCFQIEAGDNNDFYDYKWGNGWDNNGNGEIDPNEMNSLNGNNFDPDRFGKFHYTIFGHNYEDRPGSSGRGKYNEDDFFIADGTFSSTDKKVSSTFMHELGHNLGLHHYGNMDQCPHAPDHEKGKGCPNYESIMSYYYQLDPNEWPDSWDNGPNYGTHPGGWDDWNNLAIKEISTPAEA